MANTVHIDVVSAEESLFSAEATFVVAPGSSGEIGIYPHHTPLLTALKAGSVRIQEPSKDGETLIHVNGGMLEVQPGRITVLADSAIRGEDLDEAKALAAKKAAEEAMQNQASEIDYARAKAELAESIAQLQAIEKLRKTKH